MFYAHFIYMILLLFRHSGTRTQNRYYFTSHKLNSKLTHRPHWRSLNENKQFIQYCNYYKTNFVICCVPSKHFIGSDVPFARNYHISAVLFKDERKTDSEVKNVNKTAASKNFSKIDETKGDNSQRDASAKVVVPNGRAKEVGPPVKKSLGTRFKEELKHYYHGFKLLFKELRMSTRYMIDVVIFRKSLKRREFQQVFNVCIEIVLML